MMIADTIKTLRETANLTQSGLAKKLSVTRSSVNAWEMGISAPSIASIIGLSDIFKVPTDYILGVSRIKTINIDSFTTEQTKILFSLIAYFNDENNK